MKPLQQSIFIGIMLLFFLSPSLSQAALEKGVLAPSFAELTSGKKKPMTILYFFKQTSKPSIKGLERMKADYASYQKAGIRVIAISKNKSKDLDGFFKNFHAPFPIVKDNGSIFKAYGVQFIFPTTYILGPGGRVSDTLEGGGATSHHFMTTVANRSLQLKKNKLAKTLYAQVLKKDPKNAAAQAGLGQVLLTEGKLDGAEAAFSTLVLLSPPEVILGKEGLAAVHLKKGETQKAIALSKEIQKTDPQNSLVHLIKANVLSIRGDQEGALSEYKHAIEGKLNTDWQRAEAYNQAGRIHSERGEYQLAESMYQQALNENPYSTEILTNRGALYEKQGRPQKALALYREALTVDPKDEIALLLSKRIAQHLDFKEDIARQERIDGLVSELSERFKAEKVLPVDRSDRWSSRPMTIAFMGLKSIGGGLLREGMDALLQQEISSQMMSSQRVSLVEREVMEKLLTELQLGSSDLADPETALNLGKILAARLIITGNLIETSDGIRLSLRVIDPETSSVKIIYSDEMGSNKTLSDLARMTGKVLIQRIKLLYPLKGKIALVEADKQVIINLGRKHGIHKGVQMKIISEGGAIVMDGKVIGHRKQKVGLLEIISVEDGLSYGKLAEKTATVHKDYKVFEDVKKTD